MWLQKLVISMIISIVTVCKIRYKNNRNILKKIQLKRLFLSTKHHSIFSFCILLYNVNKIEISFSIYFTSNRFDILAYVYTYISWYFVKNSRYYNSINIPKKNLRFIILTIITVIEYYMIIEQLIKKNGINHKPIYPLTHFFQKEGKVWKFMGKNSRQSARMIREEKRKKGRRDSVGNEDGWMARWNLLTQVRD